MDGRLKIAYILGSGRNGSTILDALIGTAAGAIATGELDRMVESWNAATAGDLTTALSRCSCGQAIHRCPVWSPVLTGFSAHFDVQRFKREQRKFERLLLSIPRAAAGSIFGAHNLTRHLDAMASLIRSIAVHGHADLIVDSSKNPCRGWLYAHLPKEEFDVRFIHLVRDGRQFMASNLTNFYPQEATPRPPPWPPIAASLYAASYWVYTNLHSSLLGIALKNPYSLVRYEDLVRRPSETVDRLESFLDIDMEEPRRRIAHGVPLARGHILYGNRSKQQPTLRVQKRPEPSPALKPGPSLVFTLVAQWLQTYYSVHSVGAR